MSLAPWIAFNLAVLLLLAMDLGVFHRHPHAISYREAALWSAFWIILSLGFALGIFVWQGSENALEFMAGYTIEKSLSLDNIFVFAVIFSMMGVESKFQHKVLYWGILGALVTRGAFIFVGVELIARFGFVLYVLAGFLIFSGARLLTGGRGSIRPKESGILRFVRRILPVTETHEGASFFVRRCGHLMATPLLLALVLMETTDVLFAVDSIPAVFGVTQDPFLIYTSNVCAILGLRSLYFVLAGAMRHFRYLHVGLSLILIFVGIKMIFVHFGRLPTELSLGVICLILVVTILASLHAANRDRTSR